MLTVLNPPSFLFFLSLVVCLFVCLFSNIDENEVGLDEGVEEGCSSLEPLSQDDCSSECSASFSRHPRNQPEPLSLTVGHSRDTLRRKFHRDGEFMRD